MTTPDAIAPTAGRWRRLRTPLAWGAATAVGTAYLYAVDPSVPGRYPVCPTYALAGIYCPGCGMLRSCHALLHGDLGTAMERNPLVPLLLLIGAVLLVRWALARRRGAELHWDPPRWFPAVLAVTFVAVTVVRNIPGWTWASPQ